MRVCQHHNSFIHRLKLVAKLTPVFIATAVFCTQTALAKNQRHHYDKRYKYAKEEFIPQAPRYWGSLEYMGMWEEDGPLNVPLLTRNNETGATGAIGETGTQVIYGNGSGQDLDYGNLSGGRLTFGGWVDPDYLYGLEFSGFLLEKGYTNFQTSSPGGTFPIVSIPYFLTQPTPGAEAAFSADGNPNNVSVNTSSQLWGAEANIVLNFTPFNRFPLEGLVGFRYMNLNETLSLSDSIFNTAIMDTTTWVNDSFETQNSFYGLQLGLRTHLVAKNKLTLDLVGKVALGENAETITIDGITRVTNDAQGVGTTGVVNAGIFAQSSNIGSFQHNFFTVLPELQIKVGYMAASNIHPYIGYDVMYLNKVVRPGKQIDRNINLTENPLLSGSATVDGGLSPTKPGFNNSSYWIQGFVVGCEIKF